MISPDGSRQFFEDLGLSIEDVNRHDLIIDLYECLDCFTIRCLFLQLRGKCKLPLWVNTHSCSFLELGVTLIIHVGYISKEEWMHGMASLG